MNKSCLNKEKSLFENLSNSGKAKSLRYANPEPSLNKEGVETVRETSYWDEETVQLTNIHFMVAKAMVEKNT